MTNKSRSPNKTQSPSLCLIYIALLPIPTPPPKWLALSPHGCWVEREKQPEHMVLVLSSDSQSVVRHQVILFPRFLTGETGTLQLQPLAPKRRSVGSTHLPPWSYCPGEKGAAEPEAWGSFPQKSPGRRAYAPGNAVGSACVRVTPFPSGSYSKHSSKLSRSVYTCPQLCSPTNHQLPFTASPAPG